MKNATELLIDEMLSDEEKAPGFIAQHANDPEMFKKLMQLYLLKQLKVALGGRERSEKKR